MDRLTFDGNFCDIARCAETPGGSFCEDGSCSQKRVWERLKAYEDTRLDPHEISRAVADTIIALTELERYENLGVAADRLCELAQADKEGRVVVLPPCKIGEYVWLVIDGTVVRARNKGMKLDMANQVILCFGGYPFAYAYADEIGKTVFLTREEAEAALKAGAHNG